MTATVEAGSTDDYVVRLFGTMRAPILTSDVARAELIAYLATLR